MSRVRIAMCLLAGLGSFAIVVALLLPTLVYDRLAVTPLDIDATTVATTADGAGGEVLDSTTITGPGPLSIATDVPLVLQRYITVEDPSDADRVTFQVGATVRRADRDGDAGLLTASVDRVTSDRRTGLPVEPAGSLQTTVDSPAIPLPRTGLQHRFPSIPSRSRTRSTTRRRGRASRRTSSRSSPWRGCRSITSDRS